jgi:hypothetical protein
MQGPDKTPSWFQALLQKSEDRLSENICSVKSLFPRAVIKEAENRMWG